MKTVSDLRAACAALPGTQENFPFDATTLVFKVGGKMYALSDVTAGALSVSLKVRPEHGEELRATFSGITPGHHLNKRHWITVALDGRVPADLVAEGHSIPVARVQAMHEGLRRKRARRDT